MSHKTSWVPNIVSCETDQEESLDAGPAIIGLKNENCAILAALHDLNGECVPRSESSPYGSPTILLNLGHFGFAYTGSNPLREDLVKYAKHYEVERHAAVLGESTPIYNLANEVAQKMLELPSDCEISEFESGALVACFEMDKPHVYAIAHDGHCSKRKACCFGRNSKNCEQFIIDHLNEIEQCTRDTLIVTAIKALLSSVDSSISCEDLTLAIGLVTNRRPFHLLEDDAVKKYMKWSIKNEPWLVNLVPEEKHGQQQDSCTTNNISPTVIPPFKEPNLNGHLNQL